jgi:hypothetical protein
MDGGIDYRAIGMRQGANEAIGTLRRAAAAWRDRAEVAERKLRLAEADAIATDAGRLAQVHALRRALEAVAPFDPILARTGRLYEGGDPERFYEQPFADTYDDAARGSGLPRCERPMTCAERAEAVEAQVLAEPVSVEGWGWWKRITWRGIQHRTLAGAKRFRAEAAAQARQEAMGS